MDGLGTEAQMLEMARSVMALSQDTSVNIWEAMEFIQKMAESFRDIMQEMQGVVCKVQSAVKYLEHKLCQIIQDHIDAQLQSMLAQQAIAEAMGCNSIVQQAVTDAIRAIAKEIWARHKKTEVRIKKVKEFKAQVVRQKAELAKMRSGDVKMGEDRAEGVGNEGTEGNEVKHKEVDAEMGEKEVETKGRED
ncbi:hypothetical protein BDQ12DRAFT_717754 [Crucibulum laeve]|uniref:Uncharacterized protein n=1 Tax=Crucibulum laeve TaxID=68775 RepID=A0A5C3MTA6_9AGAR|nr:hypothetical protein BDQ12DRAFT_717754 [Crucibulum laeve]